jgi:hydroxypyruvate isomerase
MRISACLEMLFNPEFANFTDRITAARAAGFDAVEFWRWSNKDIDAVAAALQETGMPLAGILCEPIANLTDPATHPAFLDGVRNSLAAAKRLGTRLLIGQSGNLLPGVSRAEQHAAIVACLKQAAEILEGSGVVIALEPLNDLVNHPGYFLTSTVEALDIIDEVGRPEIRLLYDIYHAAVMGEAVELTAGRVGSIAHVHLADTPGRHEPGSGVLDWQVRRDWLRNAGYGGLIGLEYRPSGTTLDSLKFLETV